MERTMLIPVRADYYPRPGMFGKQLDQAIEGHRIVIDNLNKMNATNFAEACANWKQGNLRNRDMGLPIAAKPVAQPPRVLRVLYVMGPAAPPVDGDSALEAVVADGEARGVYMWEEDGPAAVCPDLPAVVVERRPIPEPAHVVSVPADDAIPIGMIVTAPDGTRWQKHRATTPFGTVAWLEQLA